MGLSAETVGKFLKRATASNEVEEVLHAYVSAKFTHGSNVAQVLRKLHLLTLYLRAIDLGYILRKHYEAFAVTAFMVKSVDSQDVDGLALLSALPRTALGNEAYNAARRPPKSILHWIATGKRSKSSMASSARSSASTLTALSNTSSRTTSTAISDDDGSDVEQEGGRLLDPDAHDDSASTIATARARPRLGSRTTSAQSARQATREEVQERARRAAGAGVNHGMGRGLLSAPPEYDGSVAAYVERYQTALQSGRTSFEELPGYVAA